MVDRGKLGTTTAVELSYLSKKEQEAVQTAIESEQSIPSQTQAKMLRRLHDEDEFTEDTPLQVLSGNKGKAAEKLSIPMETLERFFRRDETPTQMIEAIVKAHASFRSRTRFCRRCKKQEGRRSPCMSALRSTPATS